MDRRNWKAISEIDDDDLRRLCIRSSGEEVGRLVLKRTDKYFLPDGQHPKMPSNGMFCRLIREVGGNTEILNRIVRDLGLSPLRFEMTGVVVEETVFASRSLGVFSDAPAYPWLTKIERCSMEPGQGGVIYHNDFWIVVRNSCLPVGRMTHIPDPTLFDKPPEVVKHILVLVPLSVFN